MLPLQFSNMLEIYVGDEKKNVLQTLFINLYINSINKKISVIWVKKRVLKWHCENHGWRRNVTAFFVGCSENVDFKMFEYCIRMYWCLAAAAAVLGSRTTPSLTWVSPPTTRSSLSSIAETVTTQRYSVSDKITNIKDCAYNFLKFLAIMLLNYSIFSCTF